jgi:hypothetical protein
LRVKFLDDSYHFVSSPRARLFSFSISRGHRLSKELPYSLFFPAYWPELTWGRDCGCLKRKPYGKKDTPSEAALDRILRHASARVRRAYQPPRL